MEKYTDTVDGALYLKEKYGCSIIDAFKICKESDTLEEAEKKVKAIKK
jgi:hypothetical protein